MPWLIASINHRFLGFSAVKSGSYEKGGFVLMTSSVLVETNDFPLTVDINY